MDQIERGSAAFRRTNLALFAAGFSTFALLYCVQPLMPLFSTAFHVSAAMSSLSLSLTTGLLALSMLLAGPLSDAWGRKSVMVISLLAAAVLTVIGAFMPTWPSLLAVRALAGIAFSGLPAVAMAYLGEEMHPEAIGLAMGLYISGSGLGGMVGRLLTSLLTDFFSWRIALAAIGVLGIIAGLIFWRSLPQSRHFSPRPLAPRALIHRLVDLLKDAGLPWMFVEGFMLMGSFVTLYNYIGYRLMAPPYELSQAEVGMIFIVYLTGVGASAWVGNLAGKIGRRKVLWITIMLMLAGLGLTLLSPLAAIIIGIAVLTFGFFGSHSVVSSWIGRRAQHSKGQASAMYLFFYYTGSSLMGWAGGFFWSTAMWAGVATFIGALILLALLIALRLAVLPPLMQSARG